MLVESSWSLIARDGAVLEAAQAVLSADRIRVLHARPEQRVDELVRRGQSRGVFRGDLPATWLAGVLHHVMKGAAADVAAGRLTHDDAGPLITATILSAFAPPAD